MKVVYLAAGCFWGVEHRLSQLDGVIETQVGYMNGHTKNPTYKEVCTDTTGHAEVVKVTFDPKKLPFTDLLSTFWQLHDPTTLNRQGPDVGTQYRSGIFFTDAEQKTQAEISKQKVQSDFEDPIVTIIEPAEEFFPAEEYHQKYLIKNPGFCGI
ncbi:MAG: peptide-methionine (S)-S-oxide reductase MsrA [Bdellovibrionales bacterium]